MKLRFHATQLRCSPGNQLVRFQTPRPPVRYQNCRKAEDLRRSTAVHLPCRQKTKTTPGSQKPFSFPPPSRGVKSKMLASKLSAFLVNAVATSRREKS